VGVFGLPIPVVAAVIALVALAAAVGVAIAAGV
jgi:hypothetical protein